MSAFSGETMTVLREKLGEIGADIRAGDRLARPAVVRCEECGQSMRIAPDHMHVRLACPHCGQQFEPRRLSAQQVQVVGGALLNDAGSAAHSWRNRWVAGTLGVLLGAFGVHRFYLGYTGLGVLQIVLTFCTAGIAGIWGFVEGVLILVGMRYRDVDGLPLRE